MRLKAVPACGALCLFLFPPLAISQQSQIRVEHNVAVTMRDGTILRADIYRPAQPGQCPVLLERTPYNKADGYDLGVRAAMRGYLVVIQDTRGRYQSKGEWYPFRNEPRDGYDTVEWAASLPESDGKVGMFGGSYVGATQMLAAITHPPHLAGICPFVTASDYHDGWVYQGGALEQWFDESWTSGLAQDTLNRLVEQHTNAMMDVRQLPLEDYRLFNLPNIPVKSSLTSQLAPYFLDWLNHPSDDAYWKEWSIETHYSDIKVPALTIAAWYDLFQGGSLRNYEGIKKYGGTEAARRGQHLIVAIGGHSGHGRKIGKVDFGPAAAEFDDSKLMLDWYDYLFKGAHNEFASQKRVRIFVMGENIWRNEADWPLARAHDAKYFLHSGASANSLRGNGSLSTSIPDSESTDRYTYDPANPVPTIGGPLCCDAVHLAPGPYDQRPDEARSDVLVYSTSPLPQDLEVTGPVSLDLYASSSAVDTDFTAKLVDVWPNGFAQNLTEGIIRARYRDSQAAPEFLNPGQIYEFHIDLWSTSNVFLKGHRIRLEISSSNFPRFDRNLNSGDSAAVSDHFVSAANIIYH